ncbi:hypothetical protein BU16DRAFT_597006 [Lophium mytilinum]|uniref:Aminoglycoside phosphotransferase domain-containing protein n=1 Tax=Lophium mytilinum TaxID=390894 RepID=A0A6A6QAU2_9PEZI|nr:hypothetical protein BU16DRAFT_597006 [Lophium mytilinum]
MADSNDSTVGFRWNVFSTIPEGMALRTRAEAALGDTNWDALLEYASKLRDGTECKLLTDIGMGANHMIRVIEFDDGKRWVARVHMPYSMYDGSIKMVWDDAKETFDNEVVILNLIRESSNIPVPAIYAHETADTVGVQAPFILMECVEGNVGTDIFDDKTFEAFPDERKDTLFDSVAEVHVGLSTVLLPKIGTVIGRNEDGTYIQGPIYPIGGPFDTATEFFQAWAKNMPFCNLAHMPRLLAKGGRSAEIPASIEAFRAAIQELASKISVCDKGPFPIWHNDCGNNNIIMDDNFAVLGVIDWEMAYAAPWEVFGDYPRFIESVPRAMDSPQFWDESGNPATARGRMDAAHQKQYLAAVIRAEAKRGLTLDNHLHLLSAALQDTKRHAVAKAMWLFDDGKLACYHLVTEEFAQSLLEEPKVSGVSQDVTTASSSVTNPSPTKKKRKPLGAIVNEQPTFARDIKVQETTKSKTPEPTASYSKENTPSSGTD